MKSDHSYDPEWTQWHGWRDEEKEPRQRVRRLIHESQLELTTRAFTRPIGGDK